MTDFMQGKIYKLVSPSSNEIYIGSTCKPLRRRLSGHICNYKRFLIGKIRTWTSSYHLVNYENVDIILIEDFPCQTKLELHLREGYYIRNTMCVNKFIPGRTKQEYRYEHKAEQNAKKNTKFVCDCGGKHTRKHRVNHERTVMHQAFISKQEE